ncbi:MAG: hypothetical protein ABR583_05320 [Gaiellaceae bacterium]
MTLPDIVEPISPEVALVSPELAAVARARLPDARDCLAPARRTHHSAGRVEFTLRFPRWLAALIYAGIMLVSLFVRGFAAVALLAAAVALLAR